MIEEWPAEGFTRRLLERERIVVFYHAAWCPHSRILLPDVEAAEPEASVPFARADLARARDPRWDEHAIGVVPTLVYYEHGEELERIEALRHKGLTRRDLDEFLEHVENIQEEPTLPRRMHGPRRR